MNFEEYQKAARSSAIYPERARIVYPSLGIAGESGEISEHVKKWIRDDQTDTMSEERKTKIMFEAGDVLWYLSNLLSDLGLSLNEVAETNIVKLSSRKDRGVLRGDGDSR